MKVVNKIFITMGIYLGLALVYMLAATYIDINNLYRVAIVFNILLGILIIYTIIRMGIKNKGILFYKNKLGMTILITVLFALGGTSLGVSKLYKEKLAGTSHETLNSLTRKPQETAKSREPYQEYERENIKILYRKDVESALDLINVYIDEIQEDTEKVFGQVERQELTIKLTDEETFRKDLLVDEWTGGYYYEDLKQITIPVEDAYYDVFNTNLNYNFEEILRHEYSHYISHMFRIQNDISSDSMPHWFEEGVATTMEEEVFKKVMNTELKEIVPFSTISSSKDWRKNQAYEQSNRAIYYLVTEKGEGIIKDILLKTKEMSFEEAFKTFSGKSIEEYESILRNFHANDWENYPRVSYFPEVTIKEEKIQGLEEYIKEHPMDPKPIMKVAQLYLSQKKYKETIRVLKLAIQVDPSNSLAWYQLGLSYTYTNDFNKAQDALQESVKLEPKNSQSYMFLSNIMLITNLDKGIDTLEKGIKISDEPKYLQKALNEYNKLKDLSGMEEKYLGYLKFLKDDILFHDNLKMGIIDNILKENPDYQGPAKEELIKMKEDLEGRL
ncbi:tetratricopeptide repeat protein [Clostridium sp. D2Q-11]|uniref:Tetratricopeptide repeat protein n=1 Tax=Anaeromonas frigoriresistens TaxID=2683708 RepID=A0A942UXS3_9FIRM|nr:tetratricopeptide repeat protein [Anaeromonas frigoriresistens]MBS4538916.1 tetratricopeptide repeat protein [Anaeromonas frigoriresistens]